MKVRKYYSKNPVEGFLKVKKELGPEAIILQTRKVRERGLKGLFLPPRVEIVAALDSSDSVRTGVYSPENPTELEREIKNVTAHPVND